MPEVGILVFLVVVVLIVLLEAVFGTGPFLVVVVVVFLVVVTADLFPLNTGDLDDPVLVTVVVFSFKRGRLDP